MTDASTPLPLSRADRSQWQQEAAHTHIGNVVNRPDCMKCRILAVLAAPLPREGPEP
jgi:hypothetical protein